MLATQEFTTLEKISRLSPELRRMIQTQEERDLEIKRWLEVFKNESVNPKGVVSSYLAKTLLHCNAGATMDIAFWLKNHLAEGGKLVITLAGALSSFQVGIPLSDLIRERKVHIVSATGANHEESYYRLSAHSHYAYISHYAELTPAQEAELRDAGLRRITDTFLPEDESVRRILPPLSKRIAKVGRELTVDSTRGVGWEIVGAKYPHEFFRETLLAGEIPIDPSANPDHCWVKEAANMGIPIVIPGFEDSTMGNIISSGTYTGKNVGRRYEEEVERLNVFAIRSGLEYMHLVYDWYMENSRTGPGVAILQLGGGIAGDFIICGVPSLKHDNMLEDVRDWTGFAEIGSSPMSYGSYSGAGGKEKITWDKLSTESYYKVIQSDATLAFPLIAAVLAER